MVTVPRPPPTAGRRREYDRAHAVGQVFKTIHLITPPERGSTQLPPNIARFWFKTVGRYRYSKGMSVAGVKVGGRFVEAPENAPLARKRHGKKRLKKKKQS